MTNIFDRPRLSTARLIANVIVGAVLALLVLLCLFAHLSTLVKPDVTDTAYEQADFKPGTGK
jgi:hypothetical protein